MFGYYFGANFHADFTGEVMKAESIIFESSNFDNEGIDELYKKVTSLAFPWYLNKSTVLENMYGHNLEEMYFSHMCFTDNEFYSDAMNNVSSIFDNFCKHVNLDSSNISIIRAQINLSPKGNVKITVPHRDQMYPHKVFLCYLNDSDGDTTIFKEKEESNEYTIDTTVSPERGKAIVFNGEHYHSLSFPQENNHRIVINIDFVEQN